MLPAFFGLACSVGAPPRLAALSPGFFSKLNAAITHYRTGPAPIIYGARYVTQGSGGGWAFWCRSCTVSPGCP